MSDERQDFEALSQDAFHTRRREGRILSTSGESSAPTPKPGESEATITRLAKNILARRVGTTPYETESMRVASAYLALLTQQSQDRAEQEVLADAVVRLVNGGLNASVHMPSHERHAFRRWLLTFSDLAASPGKGAEGEARYIFPEGDARCGAVHREAKAVCLLPKGHEGDHRNTQGYWMPRPDEFDPEAAPIEDEEEA